MYYSNLSMIMKCFVIATIFVTLQFSIACSELTCVKNYCYGKEPPPDYPLKTITDLVQELNLQSSDAHRSSENEWREGYPSNLASEACDTNEISDPIYQIIDDNNKKRHVVQVADRFLQNPRVIQCAEEGKLKEERGPFFFEEKLDKFLVSCKEKMIQVPFFVLSEDGQRLEIATAKEGIPLGCYCRYDDMPKTPE